MNEEKSKTLSINIRIGFRMAAIILAVSLCITGTALFAGYKKYTNMQSQANKEIGYQLGRATAILTDQDEIIHYIDEVRRIYESAPAVLRDEAEDKNAEYKYSVERGPYEALFSSVMTEDFLYNRQLLDNVAKDIEAVDISIVFADHERGRIVNVISGISGEQYREYYSAPGYWTELYDFIMEYTMHPEETPGGIHMGYMSGNGDPIMVSLVPFYRPDTKEVLGFVSIEKTWIDIDKERKSFLAGFAMSVVSVTIVLLLLSQLALKRFILKPISQIAAEKSRMATELDVASNIQSAMLPDLENSESLTKGYSVHAFQATAREVGGDFYDAFTIDDDHVALVIADVVGKGVPASLFAMVAKTMINMSARNGRSAKEVCEEVNERLCENNKESMFVTVWFGIYTISEKKLVYVSAGHNPPAFYQNGIWQLGDAESDPVMGVVPGMLFNEHTCYLKEGESVLLYTDGVVEAQREGENAELYGEERFISCLEASGNKRGEDLIEAVYEEVTEFMADSPQYDDITMVLFEVTEKAPTPLALY
ncbi:MAG: PP2C family protein-serine/threonine phosphatase [Butyrivibrio sp.]|nr:PP2C family protein-serine/threonine phosphatase [Butyrivibrio sp.]